MTIIAVHIETNKILSVAKIQLFFDNIEKKRKKINLKTKFSFFEFREKSSRTTTILLVLFSKVAAQPFLLRINLY